jgi:hypothetical protein
VVTLDDDDDDDVVVVVVVVVVGLAQSVELDPDTGRLSAFRVRADGVFSPAWRPRALVSRAA